MQRTNHLGILMICLAAAAIGLSACGGDDVGSSPGTSTSATGTGATSTTGGSTTTTDTSPTALQQIAVNPPPMGWSSWNSLEENVSFDTIKAQADGLAALNANLATGNKYQYVNIDEGWWTSRKRDANGDFILNVDMNGNPTNQWPGGMKAMADYIHGKGLKAGIYIDSGPQGCGNTNGTHFVGSDYAHYDHDFLQFAQWGYDFVKVDWCGGRAAGYDPQQAYTAISQAIQKAYVATGKRLVLNMCDWGTLGQSGYPDYNLGPWDWGAGIATSWRTTGDIYGPGSGVPKFGSVLGNFNGNYHPEGQHTGYYNDPDMMVAGMGMTAANDLAHVNLWAIAGAPMILGNDLSKSLSSETVSLLTNPELIAIDQDMLGLQGLKVADANGQQVWAKLLAGAGKRAVLLFNNGTAASDMTVTWQQLGFAAGTSAVVRDVWAHKDLGAATGSYTVASVPAGGTVMLVLSGTDLPSTTYLPGTLSGGATIADCAACASGRKVTGLGAVTFNDVSSQTAGGYVQIAYLNTGTETVEARLGANGGNGTTLAFPPTGKAVGTVTVFVNLQSGQNTLTLSSLGGTTAAPDVTSIAVVAGPVKVPPPPPLAYEAEAAGNTLGGAARVSSCGACSGGQDVGYVGNGDGTSNGTLTINGISVAADGTYSVAIAYVNGDSAPRSAQLSFDGAAPVSVSFPSTGGWGNVSTLTVTGAFRQGSANTLKFANPTGWAPDIDGIGAPAKQ